MAWDAQNTKTPAIQTDLVIWQKQDGAFEYLAAPINDRSHAVIPLPNLLKSRLIQEYGQELKPLPIIAITDGAKVIHPHCAAVFGGTPTMILDWYHLGKKVRDFMSRIAWTKEEKNQHLKFIFHHW